MQTVQRQRIDQRNGIYCARWRWVSAAVATVVIASRGGGFPRPPTVAYHHSGRVNRGGRGLGAPRPAGKNHLFE